MASHEPSPCQDEVKIGSDRSFGLVFAAVFVAIAGLPLLRGAPVRWWALALAAIFALAALTAPSLLRPLNRIWFKFGLVLHHIVNPIMMGAIFFIAVTPMALVMRALGRDPLRLKRDPACATYWVPRERPAPAPRSMAKQFQEAPMSIVVELWQFMRERKKFWLLPLMMLMLLTGGLIVVTKGSAVAPFIYAVF